MLSPICCNNFVIISRRKSILGLGVAVESTLLGAVSSNSDAKSINDNGFFI